MKYDLNEFENLVNSGHLRKAETEDLVLYTYTDLCTHEKLWNEYTRVARGIILEKSSGEVIAKPFPKFFNLGEMPETQLPNFPNEPYKVYEKLDGSLGIIYFHKGWQVATKGSFSSPQALKAQELLKKYELYYLRTDCTFLVEIIYPDNKIVVDYGKEEKLVFLGGYENDTGKELLFSECPVGEMEAAKSYNYTFEEMIELQKTLPKDQEGFVVRFENGLRLKIKGEEYLKIHKIISNLSPISFWESMENGKVPLQYLVQIPEEFKKDFEPIVETLENNYEIVQSELIQDFEKLPIVQDKDCRKEIGLFLKTEHNLKHPDGVFPFYLGNSKALNSYIMKRIRPHGNNLILSDNK